MQTNEIKNINFLGQKRNINNPTPINLTKLDEEEKTKEYLLNQLTTKKRDIFITFKESKNRNNLEEKNDTKIDNNINRDIKDVNIMRNIICQKCNSKENVLSFNSIKNILEFFSQKNISIFNCFNPDENLIYDNPKTICIKCLLMISKDKTEMEKFFGVNSSKIKDDNDNIFDNLFENPNLKNFNNIETKKIVNIDNNKNKSLDELNNKMKDILDNFYSQNAKMPTLLNNIPSNNNNIFNNPNINFDFLNISNYLPLINFNLPFNQNISNLSIPNLNSNDLNTCQNNFKTKNNIKNQTNPLQHQILNNKDILQNSLFNKPPGLLTPNNTDLINIFKNPLLNKNSLTEKNKQKENGQSIIINNNIETKNIAEKKDKDVNENLDKRNIPNDFIKIKNKDFDEIFEMTNSLYNKLLDIKVNRDLNLVTTKILDKDNQKLSSNNLNILKSINNKLEEPSKINRVLNQISNDNNLDENNFNFSNNKSNNDILCNQNFLKIQK